MKTPKAVLNKEISAHIIRIEEPEIEIRISKEKKEKEIPFAALLNSSNYRQLLGKLNSVKADSLVIENASLKLIDYETGALRCKAGGISFRFSGIEIFCLKKHDSSRFLFSEQLMIHCSQMEFPQKNNLYTLKVSGFDFNSAACNLHTDKFILEPLLSEKAFAALHHFSEDRFDIRTGAIELRNINRMAMLNEKLIADSLLIRDIKCKIFRDKSKPHDSVDRTHDFPQEALMRLATPIHIRTLQIRDSYIEYKEKNEKSDSSGIVAFHRVEAKLDNITNMPDSIRTHGEMNLDFRSYFLNASLFSAKIQMRLNDSQGNFVLDAKLGDMDANALNSLLKPMALAEIKKGKIKGLHYVLHATNKKGWGKLEFKYENLSLKLLKKDEDKNVYKTKFFPTLAAGLIVKKSNPGNGEIRFEDVVYERDIHRSIFNFMWKSLFSGIKKTAL